MGSWLKLYLFFKMNFIFFYKFSFLHQNILALQLDFNNIMSNILIIRLFKW